jgi:hypothetical protein
LTYTRAFVEYGDYKACYFHSDRLYSCTTGQDDRGGYKDYDYFFDPMLFSVFFRMLGQAPYTLRKSV